MRVVSVIIPAKNEERYIHLCLSSLNLLKLDDDWQLEVIVVNNMSTDQTENIAKSFGAKVVPCNSTNIGEIRAIGASVAQGEILAYVDADCEVKLSWLASAMAGLKDPTIGAIGGYLDLPATASWVERGWALPLTKSARENVELVGASFIITRDVYDGIGGFNIDLCAGEDSDLSRRLLCYGYKTKMIPDCNVVHYGYPSTVGGVIDRQIWQVSGQLSIKKMFSDASILLSILFVFSIISSAVLFLLGNALWFVLGFIGASLAFLFSVKRIADSGSVPAFYNWPSIYIVSILYFLGRFLGVLVYVSGANHQRGYK